MGEQIWEHRLSVEAVLTVSVKFWGVSYPSRAGRCHATGAWPLAGKKATELCTECVKTVDPQTAPNLPAGAPGNWEPKPQAGRLIPAHPHQPATPKLYYEVQVAGSSVSHSSSLNQKHSLVMPPLAKNIPPLEPHPMARLRKQTLGLPRSSSERTPSPYIRKSPARAGYRDITQFPSLTGCRMWKDLAKTSPAKWALGGRFAQGGWGSCL